MQCKCGSSSFVSKSETNSKIQIYCYWQECKYCHRTAKHELKFKDKVINNEKQARNIMQLLPEDLSKIKNKEDIEKISNIFEKI